MMGLGQLAMTACLCLATLTSATSFAQPGVTDRQRKNFADTFRAAGGAADKEVSLAALAAAADRPEGGLREDQRANLAQVYKALLDVQEHRTAVPADPRQIPEYVKANRAAMAVPAPAGVNVAPGVRYLLMWNHTALDATALDHSTLSESFGEQLGPARTSRALAIVHLAMFEAVNAISRTHASYRNVKLTIFSDLGLAESQVTPATASIDRAIVEAAYRTLVALYDGKKTLLNAAYDMDRARLGDVPDSQGNRPSNMVLGEAVGLEAASVVLKLRHFDGSELPELSSDDFASPNPEIWHQDPITKLKPALGGNWPRVKPFVIPSADAFRPGTPNLPVLPPAFGSADFINAYKEVKELGGDPNVNNFTMTRWPTHTSRTGAANPSDPMLADNTNQSFVGIFWGYDGTALLCAPPRLYNMIATSIALREKPITSVEEMSLYLAYINVTMADAGIAAWDAKYHFLYPRPITYIRAVDADNTPEGEKNARWTPLGAPVTNGTNDGRNLTPPFPSYPSGHAVFGGALFQAMLKYFKSVDSGFPDKGIPFDFVSDEFNGENRGPGEAAPRTKVTAHFDTFKDAEYFNAKSRIYLGIHWQFDADHGIMQGNKIADYVFDKFVTPAP